MSALDGHGPGLCQAIATRSARIHHALSKLSTDELGAPSRLEGWTRLTIACHLRFGAVTLARMTEDALAGRATSYYPAGRDAQRPSTLQPYPAESPASVVASLGAANAALTERWERLTEPQWETDVVEPPVAVDLGPISLIRLALLRLSEVEVHGSDLGLGPTLDHWSEDFVRLALPFRLEWLNTRRSNHQAFDGAVEGSWLLVASDGPAYLVSVAGDQVVSAPADQATVATSVVEGDSRDILALLLGRPARNALRISGDEAFARSFRRAFPGP